MNQTVCPVALGRAYACGNQFTGQLKLGRFSIQTYGFLYGLMLRWVITVAQFEWDDNKDAENQAKHHVSFLAAQAAFADPHRVIAKDMAHSEAEERFYCIGKAGGGILTVRFTYRRNVIRIIGAGYWRKGKAMYEKEDRLHG